MLKDVPVDTMSVSAESPGLYYPTYVFFYLIVSLNKNSTSLSSMCHGRKEALTFYSSDVSVVLSGTVCYLRFLFETIGYAKC